MSIHYDQCMQNVPLVLPSLVLETSEFMKSPIPYYREGSYFESPGEIVALILFIMCFAVALNLLRSKLRAASFYAFLTAIFGSYLFFATAIPIFTQYQWSKDNFVTIAESLRHQQSQVDTVIYAIKWPRIVKRDFRRIRDDIKQLHHMSAIKGAERYIKNADAKSLYALLEQWPTYPVTQVEADFLSQNLVGIAQHLTQIEHYKEANHLAHYAVGLYPDSEIALEALYQTSLNLVFQSTIEGNFEDALTYLHSLPLDWEVAGQTVAISLVADKLSAFTLATQNNGFNPTPLQYIVDIFITLLSRQEAITPTLQNRHVNCHTSDLLAFTSKYELERGNAEAAVQLGLQSEQLVHGSPLNNHYLISAYKLLASAEIEIGSYSGAAEHLAEAVMRSEDTQLHCELSWVQGRHAMDLIASQHIEMATVVFEQATSRCPFMKDAEAMKAKLTLAKGRRAMQLGEFQHAQILLSDLTVNDELGTLARALIATIPESIFFLEGYSRSRALEKLPEVDGILCRIEKNKCDTIELYKQGRRVGAAKPDRGELQFFGETDYSFTVFKSHLNDSYFGEVTHYIGMKATGRVDTDSDHRPDWEFDIIEDEIVSERQLSGKFALKFAAALNSKTQDWFSKPDMFFTVHKNQVYLGATETQMNTYRPSYSTVASIDYRHGDNIFLSMFDDDSIQIGNYIIKERYERMGSMSINSLPKTGFYAVNEHVGVYIQANETELPEGMSINSESLYVQENPFDSDLAYDDPVMTEYLLTSYDADVHSTWTELAGSIGMTQVMLLPVRNVTLLQKLILMFIGHEVSYEILTSPSDNQPKNKY